MAAATAAATEPPVLAPSTVGLDGSAQADGEAIPPPGEPYLAQRGAKLFHGRDCGWVKRIPEPERVYFKTVAEAREAGF